MATGTQPAGSFEVNIKDFSGDSMVIKVNPTWNVGRIKEEIAQRRSLQARDFKIVFAGQTLADNLTLWDIGVQGYSTLHCIRGRVELVPNAPARRLDEVGRDLAQLSVSPNTSVHEPVDGAEAPITQHNFYVYCKKPCGQIAPGKLRVRCADCKDAAFVLHSGPGEWDDVLIARRLHGQCNKTNCRGRDAEFYFKCANHATSETEECVALPMLRNNTIQVECAACMTVGERVLVFDCPDKHCMCVDCFVQYCQEQLVNRQFEEHRQYGYTIKCPARCAGSEIKESHHFRVLGKDLYDRYQRFGTEEFVLQMGGVLCPQVDCGMGLLPEDTGRRVQCPTSNGGCGFTFCRECKEAFHPGACRQGRPAGQPAAAAPAGRQFQVDQAALDRARWIQASEGYIDTNTKPCPRCRSPIEKNGGCMHMTCCVARCKYEWCWICGVAWNRQCQSSHWFG